MKEFDPTSERHYPLFIVKAVEPGCTTEVQLENLQTGEVQRISTGEDAVEDMNVYLSTIVSMATVAWLAYAERVNEASEPEVTE